MLDHPEGTAEPHRIPAHVAKEVGRPARRAAHAVQRVREVAELVQDGVVRDRPHLARMGDHGRAAAVRLPHHRSRAGAVEEARAERAEKRGVAGVVDQRLHVLTHHREELGGEIGLGIDRVVGLVGALAYVGEDVVGERVLVGDIEGEDVLCNPLHRSRRQRKGAEHEVAVGALEARFEADPDARGPVAPARILGGEVGEAVAQARRMGATPDRLAVGVEDRELDAGEIVLRQQFGEAQAQPLDPEARRELADIAAGIGIAELHGEPADALEVLPPMRVAQCVVENADALFQCARRLE